MYKQVADSEWLRLASWVAFIAPIVRKSLWTCRIVSEVNLLPGKEAIKIQMHWTSWSYAANCTIDIILVK